VDQRCEVKLVLASMPTIVVEKRGATPRVAFDRAAAAAGRTLRRRVARSGRRIPPELVARTRSHARAAGQSADESPSTERSTARRNFKQNLAGVTSALEDSVQDRPSRKSTRDSANRALRDNNLRLRQLRRRTTPKARANRGDLVTSAGERERAAVSVGDSRDVGGLRALRGGEALERL
jgi:hypothetical protein